MVKGAMAGGKADLDDEVYLVSTLETFISRALVLIVAAGVLSYFPLVGRVKLPIGTVLVGALTVTTFILLIWLVIASRLVRLPRSSLVLPALAFFAVLAISKVNPMPPFGPAITGGGGNLLYWATPAFMSYLGYVFLDSRRERRRLLVLVSSLLVVIAIIDFSRMGAAALGYGPAFRSAPMPNSSAEMGLYVAFVGPLLVAQVVVRRSWISKYAFIPSVIVATLYAVASAPTIALLATLAGLAVAPAYIGRKTATAAATVLLATVLLVAVVIGGRAPVGGWPRMEQPQPVGESLVAERLMREGVEQPAGPATDGVVKMGAAPILLLLIFVAAFYMQGLPSLSGGSDVERAFILGALAGLSGYAIATVAYGSSLVVSPTVWLIVGAAARLINPDEPIMRLSLSSKPAIGE